VACCDLARRFGAAPLDERTIIEVGMQTYTAQVGPDNAAHLSALPSTGPVALIEDIGEGSVQLNDLDQLRKLDAAADGHVSEDDDNGLQIWIGGESYPVFDDLGRAMADVWGLQTEFTEAKRNADRLERLYASSVTTVVTLAGSPSSAAEQLGIDEAEVNRLRALPQ
jgi:hypothetical protein